MHLIPRQLDARDVKGQADFLSIASCYTLLRRSGRQYIGLCPFHSERHPSFYVHPEQKLFYCFGCCAGGDIFDFVQRTEGCDFLEALRIVAEFSDGGSQRQRAGCEAARERLAAGLGAAPAAATQQHSYSQDNSRTQDSRARILASLDVTERRLAVIAQTNAVASLTLLTACEPQRGEGFSFTCQKPDNSP